MTACYGSDYGLNNITAPGVVVEIILTSLSAMAGLSALWVLAIVTIGSVY